MDEDDLNAENTKKLRDIIFWNYYYSAVYDVM